MKKILIFFFLSTFTIIAHSPDTSWTKTYHRGSWDYCHWIEETSDNGFVMVGQSQIEGTTVIDIWLVRTNSNGDTLWTRSYTHSVIGHDANCVREDYDGGYVIAGVIHLSGTLRNAYIIKTDAGGDTVWTKIFGGTRNAEAFNVWCTKDSGYAVTGMKYDPGQFANSYLLKLNKYGHTEWLRTYGAGGYQDGKCVQQTADGGYMVAGTADKSFNNQDFWLIKTDSTGVIEWDSFFGGSKHDFCTSAQQTSDGGFILFGASNSFIPLSALAVKTDSLGDTLWMRTYNRPNDDYGVSVDQTTDGGYIFGGYSNNPSYRDDFWFIKADANGDSTWMKTVGYGEDQRSKCILQSNDGGYVLAGYTHGVAPTFGDFYVVKLNNSITEVSIENPIPDKFELFQNYPNPFNPVTKIQFTIINSLVGTSRDLSVQLKIYDILGNEIRTLVNEQKSPGTYEMKFDGSALTSGIYFYKLTTGQHSITKKMLLLK